MAMGQVDKLEMMANQIAQFFRSYPHDEAVAGVGTHIQAFWTPRMIDKLKAEMHARPKLDPLVVEAFSEEQEARDPVEKAVAGPGKVGELGAVDAG